MRILLRRIVFSFPNPAKFDRSWLESNKLSEQEVDRRAGEKQVDRLAKDAKGEMEGGKRSADKQGERGELRKSLAPSSPATPR